LGFDRRKARSMTDPVEADPGCRTHWKWRHSDAYFASTGKLIGPLHRVVFAIKDQYDTFDLRTTVRHERKKPRSARCVYLFDR
jgi:amidase